MTTGATSAGSSNGRTSSSVASRGNGVRSPISGVIYDPVSGLPVGKHDGVTLSPSQTGYFKPGAEQGPGGPTSRQLRLEDVYRGAAKASGRDVNGAAQAHGVNAPGVNGGSPLLPVVSELDVVAPDMQGGKAAAVPERSCAGTDDTVPVLSLIHI